MSHGEPLFEAREISKKYYKNSRLFKKGESFTALGGISLQAHRGEVLGIVGESGSGKSTFAKLVAGLELPDSGELLFAGEKLDWKNINRLDNRRTKIQMVFQDPYSSLNPRFDIHTAIAESLLVRKIDRSQIDTKIMDLLQKVRLESSVLQKYPHEISGGMLQRAGLARALILEPELLVCDEPVSALDISISVQIIALLKELNKSLGLSIIFISHDLKITQYIADNIAVFRSGKLVEYNTRDQIVSHPTHSYTKQLLEAADVQAV